MQTRKCDVCGSEETNTGIVKATKTIDGKDYYINIYPFQRRYQENIVYKRLESGAIETDEEGNPIVDHIDTVEITPMAIDICTDCLNSFFE